MCFTVGWLIQTLIWLVVVCAIIGIVRLVLPIILSWVGVAGGVVMQVLNIILIAFVIIVVLWFCYDLYLCTGPRLR